MLSSWGDKSVVRSTCYSSRGPEFSSWYPTLGCSQAPVTPALEDPMPSSGHLRHCTKIHKSHPTPKKKKHNRDTIKRKEFLIKNVFRMIRSSTGVVA